MTTQPQSRAVPEKLYAHPSGEHVSLGTTLRLVIFLLPYLLLLAVLFMGAAGRLWATWVAIVAALLIALVWGLAVSGVRVAAQWERAVILRLGRFQAIKGPGVL